EDSCGDLVKQFGSTALLDARRALDRKIGCLRPAAVGGHDGHRHAGIAPDVADLLMLLQMSSDQLITAVGRTPHRHPDHADLRAAVAIDRDQRCRVRTDELACDVVEFHDGHCVLLVYPYDEEAVRKPTARQQINRFGPTDLVTGAGPAPLRS